MTKDETAKTIALVVYMPEEVNNDANYKTGTTAPTIEMGVAVNATQLSNESDSFDNKYDLGTPWLGGTDDEGLTTNTDTTAKTVKIESAEQLASFAAKVNGGAVYGEYTVTLEKDIDLANVTWTPINYNQNDNMTFDGKNHTILNLNVSGSKSVGLFGSATGVHIKNVNLKNVNLAGVAYVGGIVGSIYGDIDTCKVENATINVTGELKGSVYEDGAKAGAIVGLLREESGEKITNCSAKDVTINGYRDLGGIVGCIYTPNTVTGNTVTNVVINQGDYSKYESGDYNTLGAIYGRKIQREGTSGTIQENTGNATIHKAKVVVAGTTAAETKTNVIDAIKNSEAGSNVILPAVEQTIDLSGTTLNGNGKIITGNDKIKVQATSTANADGVTFNGVNFGVGNETYNRINGTVIYNNCSFDGLVNVYDNSTFNNCTFKNSTNGMYLAHVYGGSGTFNGCTFNGSNRCVYIYTDGANAVANFTNCKFTMTSAGKSAIMVNQNENSAVSTVNITSCTQTGGNASGQVVEGNETCVYNGLWGVKHVSPNQLLATITVDGSVVYKNPAN